MPVLSIILILAAAGFLLWVINSYVPMQPTVKKILNVVIIVLLIIWILSLFGVWEPLRHAKI